MSEYKCVIKIVLIIKEHTKGKDIIIMSNQEIRIHRLIAMCWVLGPMD